MNTKEDGRTKQYWINMKYLKELNYLLIELKGFKVFIETLQKPSKLYCITILYYLMVYINTLNFPFIIHCWS